MQLLWILLALPAWWALRTLRARRGSRTPGATATSSPAAIVAAAAPTIAESQIPLFIADDEDVQERVALTSPPNRGAYLLRHDGLWWLVDIRPSSRWGTDLHYLFLSLGSELDPATVRFRRPGSGRNLAYLRCTEVQGRVLPELPVEVRVRYRPDGLHRVIAGVIRALDADADEARRYYAEVSGRCSICRHRLASHRANGLGGYCNAEYLWCTLDEAPPEFWWSRHAPGRLPETSLLASLDDTLADGQ